MSGAAGLVEIFSFDLYQAQSFGVGCLRYVSL